MERVWHKRTLFLANFSLSETNLNINKMKMIKTLFIAGLALASFHASAQTVDEIVAKHVEAMGGKDKLASLKSVRMTGSMSANGADVTMTTSKLNMVGLRMDMEIMGTSNYQIINAKSGWIYFPVSGMTEAKEMDPAQYKASANLLDVQGALFNYKDKGTTVEYLGKETVDGTEAYKLKLTYKNGHSSIYYLDAKTYRHIKTKTNSFVNGQEMEVETSFSDYKQNADGYWFPYSMTVAQGVINYDKIETNIPLNESLFSN